MITTQTCHVCGKHNTERIYCSSNHKSLTTICDSYTQPTEVFFCGCCGHLQTNQVVDIEGYYEHQYSLLAGSDDEDQIYKVVAGKPIFQVGHRIRTLLNQVLIPAGARVLDYGCAKGSLSRGLQKARPDITPFMFDVTDRYIPFWETFAKPSQWATGATPANWTESFDVVCSFYVLEHVPDPQSVVAHMLRLLKPGGTLYFIVPNIRRNIADLIVADHLQHYSAVSLQRLLELAGMDSIVVDEHSHDAAYVASARKPLHGCSKQSAHTQLPASSDVHKLHEEYHAISRYWTHAADRIREFEDKQPGDAAACIYGAGFYGNFISSCLYKPAAITCFIDQNPFIQGRRVHNKPVIPPVQLDPTVSLMYVGLNPVVAQSVINGIGCWTGRSFSTFYL